MKYRVDQLLLEISETAAKILGVSKVHIEPANPKFGADFAIPCFAFAAELKKSPVQIAEQLAGELQHEGLGKIEAVHGFVNLWLGDKTLAATIAEVQQRGEKFGAHTIHAGRQILIEHTDPNPFKEFHIGHVYSNTVGESLARLYALGGAKVHQISYHGDVGMHIAMAVWGIMQSFEDNPDVSTLDDIPTDERTAFLGKAYTRGATAFKEDDAAQAEIKDVNKHLYAHDNEAIDELYRIGREWSFAYFEDIYAQLHVAFEKSYYESETGPEGIEIVRKFTGKVFEESDGAVVFKGDESAGLHTRVFINSQGLPTYEAKELGLTFAKQRDYPSMDESVVVTANEIDEYFKVLIAAMSQIDPTRAGKMKHVSHGVVKLTTGKMSSRTGKVMRGVDVLAQISAAIAEEHETKALEDVKLGALKYAFLKHRIGGDIAFDIKESVSLEGNSGPYVQYAHARGRSILTKLDDISGHEITDLTDDERVLAAKISEFSSVTKKAINELAPHHICAYLYELTQEFNRFYEKNRIVDDPRQATRAELTRAYCRVLENGLTTLNIPAPERL